MANRKLTSKKDADEHVKIKGEDRVKNSKCLNVSKPIQQKFDSN